MTGATDSVFSTGRRHPEGDGTMRKRVSGEARRAARGVGRIKLVDFLLFAAFAVSGVPIAAIPDQSDNVIVAMIVVFSLFRRPVHHFGRWQLLVPLTVVALSYVGFLSMFVESSEFAADWKLRLLRMAVVSALIFVVASGRIDLRSAIAGYVSVAILNVPLFFAGVLPANYGQYLTGFFGDKNVSGLVYCILGILAVHASSRVWARLPVAVVFGALVWQTGSRTAIAAYLCGLSWVFLAPRMHVLGRWILGLVIAFIVRITSEDFAQIGIFSDREGSDVLRNRIDTASNIKVEQAGFFGEGLGEAYVVLDSDTWFFHNSFWTALVEGGWPWTIFVVGVTVVVALRPFTSTLTSDQFYAQGLAVAVFICSTRLGEVFYTVPWALVIAFALQALVDSEQEVVAARSDPTHGGGHV